MKTVINCFGSFAYLFKYDHENGYATIVEIKIEDEEKEEESANIILCKEEALMLRAFLNAAYGEK
ncbi:hypothetical protein [Caudoviricetes sp.]|nr:hypothetical protein [Caudoviricetes sp.]